MQQDQKTIRQRRFLMVLPILVIPFITFLFWALGGGKGNEVNAQGSDSSGLNTQLPDANFKNGKQAWDKMSLYEQAKRDSLKLEEAKRTDPHIRLNPIVSSRDSSAKDNINYTLHGHPIDSTELEAYEKIDEIYRGLDIEKTNPSNVPRKPRYEQADLSEDSSDPEIDRLEEMMEAMSNGNQGDPEMQQIESVLEKILEIQHPERAREKIQQASKDNHGVVFTVSNVPPSRIVSIMDTESDSLKGTAVANTNHFYNINNNLTPVEDGTSVLAEVHGTQSLLVAGVDKLSGATIKLKLLEDIYVNGVHIPKGHYLYGEYALSGGRLKIQVQSILFKKSLMPVSLSAHDMDGIEGLKTPGALLQDVGRESGNQAIQDIQMFNLDPSLTAQAASAGLQAAKSLMTRKAKTYKVVVSSGYKVLLKDKNQKN